MKKRNAGCADAVWKVIVCAEEIRGIENAFGTLISTVSDCGSNVEAGKKKLREMTGNEIVDALEARSRTAVETVQNGLEE